jgi:hypothetical protein
VSTPVPWHRPAPEEPTAAPLLMLGAAMAVGLASFAVTLADLPLPGRALLTVAAMVCVPGLPLTVAARLGSPEVQFVLGVALSLACWLLVAQLQLSTGAWSPVLAQALLTTVGVAATLVAVGTQRAHR